MIRTREKLRELFAHAALIAVATVELCACTQTNSASHANSTTRSASGPNVEMEEVVITASRHSGPAG